MRALFVVPFFIAVTASVASAGTTRKSPGEIDAMCRPYFHDACSEALGLWLPELPDMFDRAPRAHTSAIDAIVDPAGQGREAEFGQRGVYGGTYFVYGEAGPPRGFVVYDPVHRLAYFEEGCCSWHHVVLIAHVPPPPKAVASRSLLRLHTERGIRLGVAPAFVYARYGNAPLRAARGTNDRRTLRYTRVLRSSGVFSACFADTTFLFERDRLIGMDFYRGC